MIRVEVVLLASCTSTQDEVRTRIDAGMPGEIVAVATEAQEDGRGRDGRAWEDPPCGGLLLSVGLRGPAPIDVLDELPRRIAETVRGVVADVVPATAPRLAWKAPNDLIAVDDGAKVAGILVDTRTRGNVVEELIVGIGMNVDGVPFTTGDGRGATTLAALSGGPVDVAELRQLVAQAIAQLVGVSPARR